jgi:aryl sulfotransferase
MDTSITWPVKQRELKMWVADSTRWNGFAFRDDDIVIATWSKTGTTWMQQIVGQLIFKGAPGVDRGEHSPWPEFILTPDACERAEAITHRRYLKTHLPIDALVYSPKAKYIYIGRDGRDVFWSWHNHHMGFKPEVLAFISSHYPGQPPYTYPDPDVRQAFLDWLDQDALPNWPFWPHVQGWFDARHLPNLKLVHFANLKGDLRREIAEIAAFLDIEVDPQTWPAILKHCSFEYMRETAIADANAAPALKDGGTTFFNKGTNGRWRDVLTPEDIARYEAEVAQHLTPECAHWLETGELPEGQALSL